MKDLITPNQVAEVSETFEIDDQITLIAFGLELDDVVEVWMVQLTDAAKGQCPCTPYGVVLPSIRSESQLLCCGEPVLLTPDQPFLVLDAPQHTKLRIKLIRPDNLIPLANQYVGLIAKTTTNINDRLRGCACAPTGAGA